MLHFSLISLGAGMGGAIRLPVGVALYHCRWLLGPLRVVFFAYKTNFKFENGTIILEPRKLAITKRIMIKICGIAKKEDLDLVCKLNFDFAGFVLYQKSPRYISIAGLQSLNLDNEKYRHIVKTAVFVKPSFKDVQDAIKAGINAVQLHGGEGLFFTLRLQKILWQKHPRILLIKAFGIKSGTKLVLQLFLMRILQKKVDYFLLDAQSKEYGGTGQSFNWRLFDGKVFKYFFKMAIGKTPFFISGGISEQNIEKALSYSDFVDLSSGIELSKGVKSAAKITSLAKFLQGLNLLKGKQ